MHGYVLLSKLRVATWAGPINFGMGIDAWARGVARGGGFIGRQSSIGVV